MLIHSLARRSALFSVPLRSPAAASRLPRVPVPLSVSLSDDSSQWVLAELADSVSVGSAPSAAVDLDVAAAFAARERSLLRLASRLEAPKKKKAAPKKKVRERNNDNAHATLR